MRTCPHCGGTLYRQSKNALKVTQEFKLRLRCKECKQFQVLYCNALGQIVQTGPRPNGRPFAPFVFA